jgi:hypothetical protein
MDAHCIVDFNSPPSTQGDPIVDADKAFQASVFSMLERYRHLANKETEDGSYSGIQHKLFNESFEAFQRELDTYVERRIKDYLNHNPPTYK